MQILSNQEPMMNLFTTFNIQIYGLVFRVFNYKIIVFYNESNLYKSKIYILCKEAVSSIFSTISCNKN